jgi:hypothetical protein
MYEDITIRTYSDTIIKAGNIITKFKSKLVHERIFDNIFFVDNNRELLLALCSGDYPYTLTLDLIKYVTSNIKTTKTPQKLKREHCHYLMRNNHTDIIKYLIKKEFCHPYKYLHNSFFTNVNHLGLLEDILQNYKHILDVQYILVNIFTYHILESDISDIDKILPDFMIHVLFDDYDHIIEKIMYELAACHEDVDLVISKFKELLNHYNNVDLNNLLDLIEKEDVVLYEHQNECRNEIIKLFVLNGAIIKPELISKVILWCDYDLVKFILDCNSDTSKIKLEQCYRCDTNMFKLLINHGLTIKSDECQMLINNVISDGSIDLLKYLVDDMKLSFPNNECILFKTRDKDKIIYLHKKGYDLNVLSSIGENLFEHLYQYCTDDDYELLEYIINNGFNIKYINEKALRGIYSITAKTAKILSKYIDVTYDDYYLFNKICICIYNTFDQERELVDYFVNEIGVPYKIIEENIPFMKQDAIQYFIKKYPRILDNDNLMHSVILNKTDKWYCDSGEFEYYMELTDNKLFDKVILDEINKHKNIQMKRYLYDNKLI